MFGTDRAGFTKIIGTKDNKDKKIIKYRTLTNVYNTMAKH